jgi:hypothetical protein
MFHSLRYTICDCCNSDGIVLGSETWIFLFHSQTCISALLSPSGDLKQVSTNSNESILGFSLLGDAFSKEIKHKMG